MMSASAPQTTQVTGRSLLIDWAKQQDNWVRQLVGEMIETPRLSDARVDALYQQLLREKSLVEGEGLVEGDSVKVPPFSESVVSNPALTSVCLKSLKHIENVNALAVNQELEFNERLTICFGENASGKTGYVRILKQAASVRTAGPVLSNVLHDSSDGRPRASRPRASIKLLVDGKQRVIDWQGEQGVEPLMLLDVFDGRSAMVHLAEDLTYSYTPSELALFSLVMDGITRVQEKLQTAFDERRPQTNPLFVNHFAPESDLYAKIQELVASTDLPELQLLATVTPEEESTLPRLREKVDALRTGPVPVQIDRAEQEQSLFEQTINIADVVAAVDRAAYEDGLSKLLGANATHERATREALAGQDVPGVLGAAWKEFIEAAEGYIHEVHLEGYPASGQPCLYCRQPLSDAAAGLLQKYRDYCNDSLRQAVEQAREQLRSVAAAVRNLQLDDANRNVEALTRTSMDSSDLSPHLAAAREVVEHARLLQDAFQSESDLPQVPDGHQNAVATLRAALETARVTVADLRKQGKEREQALAAEQRRLHDLKARIKLRNLMPQVEEHVKSAKWADRAESYLRLLKGMKGSLTKASNRAYEELMNRGFEQQFLKECKALHAPTIQLDFHGHKGETHRRKRLRGHDLDKILSEGEQKVIALADFLAEVALKPNRTPIVLDDPVTGLDHKRLRHVVKRLIALSKKGRQVIVFTHDILFIAELLAHVEKPSKACAFNKITIEGQRIGFVDCGSHPKIDTYQVREQRIRKLLKDADKATGEVRDDLIEKGYGILRGMCEIVVEKDLLKAVIKRYQPNVRMGLLKQIQFDRLSAAIEKILTVFEKCCRYIDAHSQPLATQGVRPTLEDLKSDLDAVLGAVKEYLKS